MVKVKWFVVLIILYSNLVLVFYLVIKLVYDIEVNLGFNKFFKESLLSSKNNNNIKIVYFNVCLFKNRGYFV